MNAICLEDVFNEAKYPEITFVQPKEYPYIKSAFRAEGKHITISGPSGSGKSTLVMRLLRDFNINRVDDIVMINGRLYSRVNSIFEIFGDLLNTLPTFRDITLILQKKKFIIIDDFHYLSPEARKELAQNLKLWHENKVRFIIIGIASSATELVGIDAELGIRNDPFELKTQEEIFVQKLIGLGEQALNFRYSDEFKKEVVKASNGVPSIVHVICRTACITAGIEETIQGEPQIVILNLKDLKDSVLRIFNAKYFEKVVGLAKGKQQAKSVHNTYFDIIATIAADNRSEIPIEYLYHKIVGEIKEPKERPKKATSFYNCLKNLNEVIERRGLSDILLYSKSGYIAIEDPSFRFYLNLLDMGSVRSKVHIRDDQYPYDVAVSFSGDIRHIVESFVAIAAEKGLNVFYDFDQEAQLWGLNLREKLADVYSNEALYMVIFLSKSYPEKDWPSFELAIGKKASEKRTYEYLLPIRVDDVDIVGIKDTIGLIDLRHHNVEYVVDTLMQKIEISDELRI